MSTAPVSIIIITITGRQPEDVEAKIPCARNTGEFLYPKVAGLNTKVELDCCKFVIYENVYCFAG